MEGYQAVCRAGLAAKTDVADSQESRSGPTSFLNLCGRTWRSKRRPYGTWIICSASQQWTAGL